MNCRLLAQCYQDGCWYSFSLVINDRFNEVYGSGHGLSYISAISITLFDDIVLM